MNRDEIKEKLIALCAEIFKDSNVDTDLLEYVGFVDDLGMDSITFITLIVELEAAFDITVDESVTESVLTKEGKYVIKHSPNSN